MATLQVRDLDDKLYSFLKNSAKLQNRSISQEVITILKTYLNSGNLKTKNSTIEFLSLSGAWKDDNSADEIISSIRSSRSQSDRFGNNDGIFD